MKIKVIILAILFFGDMIAQTEVNTLKDGYISIGTDARAAGQGDIGAATSPDVFSQMWNPSKYMFSSKKSEIGLTHMYENQFFGDITQLNLNFYNKLNDRSVYALSFRAYSERFNQLNTLEFSVDGSYTLKLSENFLMAVGGRYFLLTNKNAQLANFDFDIPSSLYGVDVSGFYYGEEKAFKKFNGRWRAGFNFSNLRGPSGNDKKYIEVYAPSILKAGIGFDFILDYDNLLAITTEYKRLLNNYTTTGTGQLLDYGIEGAVMGIGVEYTYLEKVILRTGYSNGIDRTTDTFFTIGAGLKTKSINMDIAGVLGLVEEEENLLRQRLRISITIDIMQMFSN